MIDWLFQNTIDTSVLLLLVLMVRNPVRRIFGAHIAYALWILPLIKLFITFKFNRPDVMTQLIEVPDSNDLLPVYSGPLQTDQNIIQIMFYAWAVGFTIWTFMKLFNAYKLNKLINNNANTYSADEYEVKSKWINLMQSHHISSPLITGLLKPTIYLPKNFKETYSSEQQQLIIKHEVTHAKRMDLWALAIAEFYRALFWFNPLVHISFIKFQQDQEFACDRQVLKNADDKTRAAYGQALKQSLSAVLSPHSLTFFYHKHERFIMLSKHKNNKTLTFFGLLFGMIIAYPVFTETSVSITQKSVETHGSIVSFEFNDIPLQDVVMLVSNAGGGAGNLIGLDYLKDIKITANAKNVHAFDFLDELLKDNGLKVLRSGDTWQFSTL